MLARWRSDKGRFKAVFRLQFQATQVPQLKKGKGLMISLIPADVGKPTVRLEKAAVLEGNCSWENPIYETIKLVRDQKTGGFKEKLYYFNVSSGSSKNSFLGEVGIDFADFAEATETLTISLPLVENSNSCPILHVTVQKMQGIDDLRPAEVDDSPREESMDRRLEYQMSNSDRDGNYLDYTEEEQFNKGHANDPEQNRSFGESRSNNATYKEIEARGKNFMQRNKTIDSFPTEKHVHRKTSTDWSVGSASDGSMFDLTNSPEENFPRENLPETSNSSTETLKNEIRRLERQAEVSDLELQSLRKQIGKENKRVQDQMGQINSLKEEKDALETECELLQSSQKTYIELAEEETNKLRLALKELRQELQHEKSLNKTLSLRLEKTEDSNSELILTVKDLDKMLEEKDSEIDHLSNKLKACQTVNELRAEAHQKEQINAKEADELKQKIRDMEAELKINCSDKERLSMEYELLEKENVAISLKLEQCQNEQMTLENKYSESLAVTEDYQFQIQRLEERITKQALEFSESLDLINELESQVKSLEKELEKQGQLFEDDLEALKVDKVEQEQRAIEAEEALRKTRSRNANAAEHLQEEVRRLSLEMASKFDENEKLAVEAKEAQDLRLQIRAFEEMLEKANKELLLTKDQYEQEIKKLLNQTNLQVKQIELMSRELAEKHAQVEENIKGNDKALSVKNPTQDAAMDNQKWERNVYSEKKEPNGNLREKIKQMKTMKEAQQWAKQREQLERELASARKEAEKIQGESIGWKTLNDEKAILVGTLQSEMKRLQANYDDIKQCKLEGKNEKGEDSQQKKEEFTSSINNKTAVRPNSVKNGVRSPEHLKLNKEHKGASQATNNGTSKGTSKKNISVAVIGERNKGRYSEEEKTASTCHSGDDFDKLVAEVKSMNERNKNMEDDLREMQEKYSEISLKFAEVEGERQQLALTVRNLKNGKKN